jgi:flavodoxin
MSLENAEDITEVELKQQSIARLIQKHISASRRSSEHKPHPVQYLKKKHKSYEKVGRVICIHNNKKLRNQAPIWPNSEKVRPFIMLEMPKHRRHPHPNPPPHR